MGESEGGTRLMWLVADIEDVSKGILDFQRVWEMETLENDTVTAADELATLYARPLERVLRKEIDHIDTTGRAFIAASPFLVLATGSSQGLDCS
ncbi:MAG: hypothetical protein ACJ8AH_28275, partial [Stellaceae bacterium]